MCRTNAFVFYRITSDVKKEGTVEEEVYTVPYMPV
jgi:hypothetical protein